MQVSVVQQKTEPRNISIPAATIAGGAVGLVLREILPVNKEEIDTVHFDGINYKTAKKALIDDLKSQLSKTPDNEALKLYVKRITAQTREQADQAKECIRNAPEALKAQLKEISSGFISKLKNIEEFINESKKLIAKNERPYAAYILPGLAFGAAISFVYNVIEKIREQD